jgi:hypothetical protein
MNVEILDRNNSTISTNLSSSCFNGNPLLSKDQPKKIKGVRGKIYVFIFRVSFSVLKHIRKETRTIHIRILYLYSVETDFNDQE